MEAGDVTIVVEGEINGGYCLSGIVDGICMLSVHFGMRSNVEWPVYLAPDGKLPPSDFVLGQRIRVTVETIETPEEARRRWLASDECRARERAKQRESVS